MEIGQSSKPFLGFSGFWSRSLKLNLQHFLSSSGGVSCNPFSASSVVFWAAQYRLVQKLDSLQLSHFLTWVWSCLSIETGPGAPSYYPLYFAFRKVIKWLSRSIFAAFLWMFNVYFFFMICCKDYLLYITCISI